MEKLICVVQESWVVSFFLVPLTSAPKFIIFHVLKNQPLGGDIPFERKLGIEVNAEFANEPTKKNKLNWCPGTGLAVGDILTPLVTGTEKCTQ